MTTKTKRGPASGDHSLHRATGLETRSGKGSLPRKVPSSLWGQYLNLNWVAGRAKTAFGTVLVVTSVGGAHEGGLTRYRWTARDSRGNTATGIRLSELEALIDAEAAAVELER